MAKPLFQDIVPPEKKSIKKIPIPERNRDRREAPPPREEPVRTPPPTRAPTRKVREEPQYEEVPRGLERSRKRRKKTPIILTVLALLIIIGLGIFFLPKASGATVTLTPRGQTVSVNATFSAHKDATSALPYQVAVYEKDGKLTVAASSTEHADVKATGVIRIFNSYSSAPQKLVANTRFQTPSGLIFRIDQPVTIPGMTGTVPGSVDVAVTADKTGADYNVGLSDFTIPGFKGDPQYTKIFARSTQAIAGGFSGDRPKVDDAQVTAARQKIRDELEASLVRQMQENLPQDFVFLPGAYFVEYQSLPDTPVTGGVQLTERATFHGIMFKRTDIANVVAAKAQGQTSTNNDLYGTDNLKFTAQTSTSTTPWDIDPLNFTLNGTTTLSTTIDIDKLKSQLANQPRKSLSAILTTYPGVAKAEVRMRPFWKQSFPADPSEITITITNQPIPQ